MKKCGTCLVQKDSSLFYRRTLSNDGLSAKCIECDKMAAKMWRTKNPERAKYVHARWSAENRERQLGNISTWRKNNPKNVARASAKYRKKNCAYYAWKLATRRAIKRKAMPRWANAFFISEIYDLARRRTETTGIKWNVDHIVPLQGATVCGLHVENNLQVITERENFTKKHLHWPDMP